VLPGRTVTSIGNAALPLMFAFGIAVRHQAVRVSLW